MVDEELPPNDAADSVIPPGPRRSTYTPPPSAARFDPAQTDDDALAGALSQEYQRWVPPTSSIAAPARDDVIDEPPPAVTPPASSSPASSPPVVTPPPSSPPAVTPPPSGEVVSAPAPEPPASFAPSPFATPSVQVPTPPQRFSLTDEQLLEAADPGAADRDTAALLDLVERELELRQAEARRLAEWEEEVRATGEPEAEEIVSRVRSQFTGVIPIVTADAGPPPPPSVAEQLAAAPPPSAAWPSAAEPPPADFASPAVAAPPVGSPPPSAETGPASSPVIDLALADAPPPYGIVPSAVTPPPVPPPVPPLVEPVIPGPPSGTSLLFDELLRDTEPDAADADDSADDDDSDDDGVGERDLVDIAPVAAVAVGAGVSAPALLPPPGAPLDAGVGSTSTGAAPTAVAEHPAASGAGRVERSGLEPTPAERRAGRSVRLFWLWFAVNSSVVSVALGAVIVGLGVSLRQAVLATLIGVAISFLPLGLGTLAGKWSGQPTMVISRATFGITGNLIPAVLALVTRLVWAAALLWMLGTGVAEVLLGSGLVDGLGRLDVALGAAALGLAAAALVSGLGFGAIAVVSAVVSGVSAVLVIGLIVLTVDYVDLDIALSVPDGDWFMLVSGAVLVFSVVGLAWANSSGDVARYQARGTSGPAAVLFATFGATIPAFVLICWGAILAASNPVLAEGLQSNPIDLVSRLLPIWYPVPLVAAVALSLISAAALALYSAGFSLMVCGARVSRPIGVLVSVVLAATLLAGLLVLVPDVAGLFRDIVTTLAVPVAAWAGIFGAETMIRTRRVHSPSLLRSGGVYPSVRWVNLLMLLLITAIGWGLSSATVVGLQWQGYLLGLAGIESTTTLAESDAGVLVALLLGLLTPIVAGIPALRRLQAAERAAAADEAATLGEGAARETTAVTPTAVLAPPA